MKRGKGSGEQVFNREDFLDFCLGGLQRLETRASESEQLFREWELVLHECLQPEKGNPEEYMTIACMMLEDLEQDRVDHANKMFPSELQVIVSRKVREKGEEYGSCLEGIMLRWYRKMFGGSPKNKEAEATISQFYNVHRHSENSVRTAAGWISFGHLYLDFKRYAKRWHSYDHVGVAEYERIVAMTGLRKVLEGQAESLVSGFTTEAVTSGVSRTRLDLMVKRAREVIKEIRDSQQSKLETARKRRRVVESGTGERVGSAHEEKLITSMKNPSAVAPRIGLGMTSDTSARSDTHPSPFPPKAGRNVSGSGGMQADAVKEVPYLPFNAWRPGISHKRIEIATAEYSKEKEKWDENHKKSTFQRQHVVSHADEEMERIVSALPPDVELKYVWEKDEGNPQCTVLLKMSGFHIAIPELRITVPVEYPSVSCTWQFPLVELFRMNVHFSRVEKTMQENVRRMLARKDGQQSDSLRVGEVIRFWMTGWSEEFGRTDHSIYRQDNA
jgi:hypothetical protein